MKRSGERQNLYRVFISSTARDLSFHRTVIHDTIERLNLHAIDMAQFGSRTSDAITESLASVAECDIYICIVAWRYGTVKDGQIKSITHLEYEEAVCLKKPRLIFIADDNSQDQFLSFADEPDYVCQLQEFKRVLREEQIVDTFITAEELGRKVATALSRYLLNFQDFKLRAPYSLPPRTFGFVGRQLDLEQVCITLRQGHNVCLSALIAGMGGVGKSSLAAEALHKLSNEPRLFKGGITWLRCDEKRGMTGLIWLYDQVLSIWEGNLDGEETIMRTIEEEAAIREYALRNQIYLPGPALCCLIM